MHIVLYSWTYYSEFVDIVSSEVKVSANMLSEINVIFYHTYVRHVVSSTLRWVGMTTIKIVTKGEKWQKNVVLIQTKAV